MNESYGHRYVLRRMNYYDYSFFFFFEKGVCVHFSGRGKLL